MARRELPTYERGSAITARGLNATNWEIGRIGGTISGGEVAPGEAVFDNSCGRFRVRRRGQSGTLIVGIEIESVDDYDPDDIVATCRVTFRPCGRGSVPGEDSYGTIEVHDLMLRCTLNEDTDALVGRRGAACYMVPDVSEDAYDDTCRWMILSLCCP